MEEADVEEADVEEADVEVAETVEPRVEEAAAAAAAAAAKEVEVVDGDNDDIEVKVDVDVDVNIDVEVEVDGEENVVTGVFRKRVPQISSPLPEDNGDDVTAFVLAGVSGVTDLLTTFPGVTREVTRGVTWDGTRDARPVADACPGDGVTDDTTGCVGLAGVTVDVAEGVTGVVVFTAGVILDVTAGVIVGVTLRGVNSPGHDITSDAVGKKNASMASSCSLAMFMLMR